MLVIALNTQIYNVLRSRYICTFIVFLRYNDTRMVLQIVWERVVKISLPLSRIKEPYDLINILAKRAG
jgi:hypothetical protein